MQNAKRFFLHLPVCKKHLQSKLKKNHCVLGKNILCFHSKRTVFSFETHCVFTQDSLCFDSKRTVFSPKTHCVLTRNALCFDPKRTVSFFKLQY